MEHTRWLSTEEVAREMGLSNRTVRRMCEAGDLDCIKIGRQWRIAPDYKERLARNGPSARSDE